MAYELVSAPAVEPVSLSEAKTHLRVEDDAEDLLIGSLISSGREYVEAHTGRQLVTATWRLHLDRFPWCFGGDIEIDKLPVQSISSITFTDENGDPQTWAADEYETDLVGEPVRIRPGDGYVYPNTLVGKPNAAAVTFVAGYGDASDVPARAKAAILLLVGHWYENREAVSRGPMASVPMAAESLIGSLRWTGYRAGVV